MLIFCATDAVTSSYGSLSSSFRMGTHSLASIMVNRGNSLWAMDRMAWQSPALTASSSRALFCRVISRSVEQGELRPDTDVEEAAALFRQVFIGLSYQMSFDKGLDVGILHKRFLYIYELLKR